MRAVQSNHEGVLIDEIHRRARDCCGIVINPGALTHTSVAIADALSAVDLPVAEVHLSNIHRRESFRHHSYVSAVAEMVVAGAGAEGYAVGRAVSGAGALRVTVPRRHRCGRRPCWWRSRGPPALWRRWSTW